MTITGANDVPIAVADVGAAAENQPLVIDVLANNTNVDAGHVLTVTAAAAPSGKGTVSIVDNKVRFVPGADFDHLAAGATEVVTISYSIADEAGGVSSSTVAVTVTGTNDAPTVTSGAAAAAGSVVEAGNVDDGAILAGTPSATGALTASDVDDGAALTWSGDAEGAFGRFAISAAGAWTYTLDNARAAGLAEGETRTETFTATVADGFGGVATQVVTITVTGSNDKPVVTSSAEAASGSVTEAGAAGDGTAFASGMLTSPDVDAGATATWSGGGTGAFGSFSITAAGTWTYALDNGAAATQALGAGETRTETFNTVTDDKDAAATQAVTVTITGANDAPVVTGAVTGTATEDGAKSTLNALANASDVDAGAKLSVVDVPAGLPAGVSYDAQAGSFTLDPAAYQSLAKGKSVIVTVDYGVLDGVATRAASVGWTVTGVNDAPVVTGVVRGAATEGEATSTLAALANASDVDAGAVLSVVDVPATLPAGVAYDAATRSFALDPAQYQALGAGETVTVSVSYGVSDGVATTPASVGWTVTGANDAPVVTTSDDGAVKEDGVTGASGSIRYADADANGSATVAFTPAAANYLGTFDAVVAESGRIAWTFDVDNAALQYLSGTQTLVQDY